MLRKRSINFNLCTAGIQKQKSDGAKRIIKRVRKLICKRDRLDQSP